MMRKSEAHRGIPIVMMTSLPSAWPQQRELFDAVLRKPFTPASADADDSGLFRGPRGWQRR